MAGLEQIIDRILADARAGAEEIKAQAQEQAEEILSEADKEAEKITADIRKKSASDVENHKKRVQSANDLYRRTETLRCRQETIEAVIAEAYKRVCEMDADSYFDMMQRMIEKYAQAQAGQICFSEKDQARMPQDFEKRVQEAAERAGGSLTFCTKKREIENGFILIYGGIEENCTLQALFDARRDEMLDTVNAILYEKEA